MAAAATFAMPALRRRTLGVALDRLGNRAGRMVKGMGGAFDKLRRNLFSMRGLIASLGVLRRTGVALDRLGNRAGRMVKGMGGAFDKLRRNLFSMRGLIASLGVGLAFRAITQATI